MNRFRIVGICAFCAFVATGCEKGSEPEAPVKVESIGTEQATGGLSFTEAGCTYSTQQFADLIVKIFEYRTPVSVSKITSQIVVTHPKLVGLQVDSQDRYMDLVETIEGEDKSTAYIQLVRPAPGVVNGSSLTIDIPSNAAETYGSIKERFPSRPLSARRALNLRLFYQRQLVAIVMIYLTD